VLVNLGSCKKVEVVITSPASSFLLPAGVFFLGGPPAGAEVAATGVTFTDLDQNLIRVVPVLDCPEGKCSFQVTYSPGGAHTPAVSIGTGPPGAAPPDANSAVGAPAAGHFAPLVPPPPWGPRGRRGLLLVGLPLVVFSPPPLLLR